LHPHLPYRFLLLTIINGTEASIQLLILERSISTPLCDVGS
jgi:hypothetical protein